MLYVQRLDGAWERVCSASTPLLSEIITCNEVTTVVNTSARVLLHLLLDGVCHSLNNRIIFGKFHRTFRKRWTWSGYIGKLAGRAPSPNVTTALVSLLSVLARSRYFIICRQYLQVVAASSEPIEPFGPVGNASLSADNVNK